MGNIRRIFVEKKEAFAGEAKNLRHELRSYLGLRGLTGVRILVRYDIENLPDEVWLQAKTTVFSEPPVDDLYEEEFPLQENDRVFAVEYLPGQFDLRADSAIQCVRLLDENVEPLIRTAMVYVLSGSVSEEEYALIRDYCCNPVDSRIASEQKPATLEMAFAEPADIKVFEGFCSMEEAAFRSLYDSLGLAMTYADFVFIRSWFEEEEKRDPTVTEIRVLDTYWSDHCRHTTFSTELKDITLEDGFYRAPIEAALQEYLKDRDDVYGPENRKYVCLMDLAVMGAKKLKKDGILTDQEETDEINACSIIVPVEVDGKKQEWLIQFKNETHNHPTEIEPFGGAATCLGGAIRDPLSGRAYVYQAMRVTGAADPENTHGADAAGPASAEEAGPGSCPRLQLLREPGRPGHRICERDLSSRLCREAHGNRCRHRGCAAGECRPRRLQARRRGHTAWRQDRKRRDRRRDGILQGTHDVFDRDMRRRGPEGKCADGAEDPEAVPPEGGLQADPQVQ